jgi:dTMP kinase
MTRGKFITLEGIDGAGKSTHLGWLEEFLRARGLDVVVTREPGGTPLGERLRSILLGHDQEMHPETEALLMFAARREHLHKVIRPALESGRWVVSDRFTDASFAYQGGGRNVDWDKLEALEHWVQEGLQPDLTLLFDVPVEIGKERLSASRDPDRFEREQKDFFTRTREAYLKRARESGGRIVIVDAMRPITDIHRSLEETILMICNV